MRCSLWLARRESRWPREPRRSFCRAYGTRPDVGLTFVTIPGEKEMNSDFEVKAMEGRIVGARIVKDADA
jgi:hypothetical protein